MRHFDPAQLHYPARAWAGNSAKSYQRIAALLLCLLVAFVAACTGNSAQTILAENGSSITYNTLPQSVLLRMFYGGGKVDPLELTPDVSVYGDGSFIIGSGLQPAEGAISNSQLQSLLHTLVNTDDLLQLQRRTFADIPDESVTLLQLTLSGKNYQFVYGPFGHLAESSQDLHAYQQLGNAITAIRNALTGSVKAYTAQKMALLVSQTFRFDFTEAQVRTIPVWHVNHLDLAQAATDECGSNPPDPTRPNADSGCLVDTAPHVAIQPDAETLHLILDLLPRSLQRLFQENGNYYIVMLRPLLPDEIVQQYLAMYSSNVESYNATLVPLQTGAIPGA
jgi:hypothetical protein